MLHGLLEIERRSADGLSSVFEHGGNRLGQRLKNRKSNAETQSAQRCRSEQNP
jgi:hypothetical protein